eukprot:4097-Chlamydomonas_euryale.AAC.1
MSHAAPPPPPPLPGDPGTVAASKPVVRSAAVARINSGSSRGAEVVISFAAERLMGADDADSRYSLTDGSHRALPCRARASGGSSHRWCIGRHSMRLSAFDVSGSVSSQSPCSSHMVRRCERRASASPAPPSSSSRNVSSIHARK